MIVLKNFLVGILAIISFSLLTSADAVLQQESTGSGSAYPLISLSLVVGAVVFLHWTLRGWLAPLDYVSQPQRKLLRRKAAECARNKFFLGSTRLGYILLSGWFLNGLLIGYLGSGPTEMPSMDPDRLPAVLTMAIFLIGAGLVGEVRGIVLILLPADGSFSDDDLSGSEPTGLS